MLASRVLSAEDLTTQALETLVARLNSDRAEEREAADRALEGRLKPGDFERLAAVKMAHADQPEVQARLARHLRRLDLGFEPGRWEEPKALLDGAPEDVFPALQAIVNGMEIRGLPVDRLEGHEQRIAEHASDELLRRLASSGHGGARVLAREILGSRGALRVKDLEIGLYDEGRHSISDGFCAQVTSNNLHAVRGLRRRLPDPEARAALQRYFSYGTDEGVLGFILQHVGDMGLLSFKALRHFNAHAQDAALCEGALCALARRMPEHPEDREATLALIDRRLKAAPWEAASCVALLPDAEFLARAPQAAAEIVHEWRAEPFLARYAALPRELAAPQVVELVARGKGIACVSVERAVRLCVKLAPPAESLRALKALYASTADSSMRSAALRGLGRLADEESLAMLRACCEEPKDSYLRATAARELTRRAGLKAEAGLRKALALELALPAADQHNRKVLEKLLEACLAGTPLPEPESAP
ncbi:MAG: HEAT repeat domain-containing protein [Planctomycetota bacterium]|nr:HEAT repeat domain-containing protein [Planctomycetota bacterium]